LEALRTDIASPERNVTAGQDGDWKRSSFCVKLLSSLNHTKEHPEDGGWVGTMWSADGETVFVHSRIFGQFLGVRTNTINRNFRNHGFVIVANGQKTDPELANAPKSGHWRRRWHPDMRMEMKIEEAKSMGTKVNRKMHVT
jgi:hypothetical protein